MVNYCSQYQLPVSMAVRGAIYFGRGRESPCPKGIFHYHGFNDVAQGLQGNGFLDTNMKRGFGISFYYLGGFVMLADLICFLGPNIENQDYQYEIQYESTQANFLQSTGHLYEAVVAFENI